MAPPSHLQAYLGSQPPFSLSPTASIIEPPLTTIASRVWLSDAVNSIGTYDGAVRSRPSTGPSAMSFPLTITIYEEPPITANRDDHGSFTCEPPSGKTSPAGSSAPEVAILEIGPGQTLAEAFKQKTGKDLPDGCWLPVDGKEDRRISTEHITVYVYHLTGPSSGERGDSREDGMPVLLKYLGYGGLSVILIGLGGSAAAGCYSSKKVRKALKSPGKWYHARARRADRERARLARREAGDAELAYLPSDTDSDSSDDDSSIHDDDPALQQETHHTEYR